MLHKAGFPSRAASAATSPASTKQGEEKPESGLLMLTGIVPSANPSMYTVSECAHPPPDNVPLKVVLPLMSVSASAMLPPGHRQRFGLYRMISRAGPPRIPTPRESLTGTSMEIPVDVNVSPWPSG